MYGFKDNCILNDGQEALADELFKNSYQNDESGKKNFMKLWLHAYRYTVPVGEGFDNENEDNKNELNDEKSIKVKTIKPKWALSSYIVNT